MKTLDLSKPRNEAALALRREAWENRAREPRVGDFIQMKDGTLRRFTYDWGDSLQVTAFHDEGYGISFYLDKSGHADFSGSLDPSIHKSKIMPIGESHMGQFWIFDEDIPGGSRGRTFFLPCTVFKEL